METLLRKPGDDSTQCTARGDWCASLLSEDDQQPAIIVRAQGGAETTIELPATMTHGAFDNATTSVWPVWTRLAGGGALLGVIYEQSTMYSGGGASSSTLTIYRLSRGAKPTVVLELPWEARSMIRACFSERDFRQRAGACHDEYSFAATLTIEPGGAADAPILRYQTAATSFPGHVSRSADSLAGKQLRRRDIVRVTDETCSVTRVLRLNPVSGTYEPDHPLPDCGDYTAL